MSDLKEIFNKKKLRKFRDFFYNAYISTVFNRLKEMKFTNDHYRKRWFWELMQNAKDTIADDETRDSVSIYATVDPDGNTFTFSHTGRPFTPSNQQLIIFGQSKKKTKKTIGVKDSFVNYF